MTSHQTVSPDSRQNPANPARIINFTTIAGTVAVTVFVATEASAVSFAIVWAISGLAHLMPAMTLILYCCATVAVAVVSAKVAMLAWASETNPANNSLPAELSSPRTSAAVQPQPVDHD
jgi:hypothetical protein